jgi:hypothetical protein
MFNSITAVQASVARADDSSNAADAMSTSEYSIVNSVACLVNETE